jgi:hypothetical protein
MSLRPRPLSGQAAGIPDVVRSAKHSDSVKRKLAQRLPSEEFRIRRHDPDLWLYRERTMGILRRYQRLSVEVGRLPSLLGREFFRTRVTSYHAGTFEDSVIFVHDVARGLEQLGGFEYKLIAKIALQDYTQHETARCWGVGDAPWDGVSPKRWTD